MLNLTDTEYYDQLWAGVETEVRCKAACVRGRGSGRSSVAVPVAASVPLPVPVPVPAPVPVACGRGRGCGLWPWPRPRPRLRLRLAKEWFCEVHVGGGSWAIDILLPRRRSTVRVAAQGGMLTSANAVEFLSTSGLPKVSGPRVPSLPLT